MAPTATMRPGYQTYFGAPPEIYPLTGQMRTDRSMVKAPLCRTAYPGLQAPMMDRNKVVDAYPAVLNRPRRLSSSPSMSSISTSRDSLESRVRSSSWGSRTSFESMDSADNPWRPEYLYQRPHPVRYFRKAARPGELFAALPGEVLELILDELKRLHLRPGSDSCATCWMRDLCSMSVASRKWSKFARTSLYEDIQLVGADSAVMKKRYKQCASPRLELLRRTLRSNPQIAPIVHSLKVPGEPPGITVEQYHNLVASVVMACPNLERLVGLNPRYAHAFDRLFHALSTRPRLKQMDWIIDSSSPQRQHRLNSSSGNQKGATHHPRAAPALTPGDLQPSQGAAFFDHHVNWCYLTTLTIHCLPEGTLTPDHLIPTTISYLPALQHLFLSHLPFTAFKDSGLLALPPLKTLSLTRLPGVTSSGLSALATRSPSRSIRRLVLRHVNLDSMSALVRILSNMICLETFSFVQSYPPELPEDNLVWLMPYLASPSLRKLHWDITSPTNYANAADTLLSRSIGANGFPALRTLRAPNDPAGVFQQLCSPQDRADLPGDRYRLNHGDYASRPSTGSTGKLQRSPTSPRFPPDAHVVREASDLHAARLSAQSRVESARRFPRYFINVIDERGMLVEKYGLAGFIGTVESRIRYNLAPDAGAKDEHGGLVEVSDLLGHGGEDLSSSEGCNGRWNTPVGPVDKKMKERWWHAERGRWRGVQL